MTSLTHLPSRPLRPEDTAALDEDDRLRVVPYGGVPERDEVRIYAVKIATGETAHALGFDDSREQWQRLASIETDDLTAADEQLDSVLDEWVQDRYDGKFDVFKTL